MSELNDLIEQLYAEGIEPTSDDVATASSTASNMTTEGAADTERLLAILNEMGALLQEEDQPDLNQAPPVLEARMHIINHWEAMMESLNGTRQHMQSLEHDIAKMQPWGDFDVMKVEQLAARGCRIRFWQMSSLAWADQVGREWLEDSHVLLVSQDAETAWFVTVTLTSMQPQIPAEAREVEICPCPVSTLIMLQTRDKDSLTRLETLMGDYALCHYGEVYAALRQLLPPDTPLPQLTSQRPTWQRRLRSLSHLFHIR